MNHVLKFALLKRFSEVAFGISEPISISLALRIRQVPDCEIEELLSEEIDFKFPHSEIQSFVARVRSWLVSSDEWTKDTAPGSNSRMELIIRELGVEKTGFGVSVSRILTSKDDIIKVIEGEATEDWVTPDSFPANGYWVAYRSRLANDKWSGGAISQLDSATTIVLNKLCNPALEFSSLPERRVKGAVIGYVQSGKTANFSGLVAKASDCGYKLIIILAGRTDLLRNQTQERLDKDVLGLDAIDKEEQPLDRLSLDEYTRYADWHQRKDRFKRLTKQGSDFQPGSVGSIDPSVRIQIAVIKKEKSVLKKFSEALLRSGEWTDRPVLVIDDESDEASVNTAADEKELTAIAGGIAQLLSVSRFSQYVGYTATPYANVFIRPDRDNEVYPNDFIVPLPSPDGYQGLPAYFDIPGLFEESESRPSNEERFLREADYTGEEPTIDDMHQANIEAALDSFVLAGALKLWREENGVPGKFRHHTMMIHTDQTRIKHQDMAELVEGLLAERNDGLVRRTVAAHGSLEELYTNDFFAHGKEVGAHFPASFHELIPFIGNAMKMILDCGVKKVNSDEDSQKLDFSRSKREWAIVVGGQKLSRGFTIEGLTTSYLARKPGAIDTLLQMARWCGYRPGYADLVRIFLPSRIPIGQSTRGKRAGRKGRNPSKSAKFYPLRDYFRQAAKLEKDFRVRLPDYTGQITPGDLRPLVLRSFEDLGEEFKALRPTSIQKSRYVEYVQEGLSRERLDLTLLGGSSLRHRNLDAFRKLIASGENKPKIVNFEFSSPKPSSDQAFVTEVSSKSYLKFLQSFTIGRKHPKIEMQKYALERMKPIPMTLIFFLPKTKENKIFHLDGFDNMAVWSRAIVPHKGQLSAKVDRPYDPGHKKIAQWLIYESEADGMIASNAELNQLRSKEKAVLYFVLFNDSRDNFSPEEIFFVWRMSFPDTGDKIKFIRVGVKSMEE